MRMRIDIKYYGNQLNWFLLDEGILTMNKNKHIHGV